MTLTKVMVPPVVVVDDRFGKEVEAVLGYRGVRTHMQKISEHVKLLTTLAEHAIPWYDLKDVARYKAIKGRRDLVLLVQVTVGAAVLSALLLYGQSYFPGPLGASLLAAGVCVGVAAVLTLAVLLFGDAPAYRWRRASIYDTRQPIPLDVLKLALRVKQLIPAAGLHVESLVKQERVMDPFLVVTLGEAEAYIAVWDEPTFSGVKEDV